MRTVHRNPWLVLIHQIPPRPNYLRVKTWRRLQRLGAVSIKNSVYVLPNNEESHEAFQWVMREIVASGGEASLCEAEFVEGLRDEQVEALFRSARAADYAQVAEEARQLMKTIASSKPGEDTRAGHEGSLTRLKRRLAAIADVDFFNAPGRQTAESLLRGIETRLRSRESTVPSPGKAGERLMPLRGRTWVTRTHVHVDRMASAWLIRRFINPRARFHFVEDKTYKPKAHEIRFDMFEAEFTHEGDRCTFEVLMNRARLADPALREIAELIHEIDLKDGKYLREEVIGVERVIAGIAQSSKDDETRLAQSAIVFDALYVQFTGQRRKGRR